MLDEANAFFWLWHFKVGDVNEATVPNYVQLILASQNHKHASKIVLLDKTLFNMKSCSHTMLAAGLWIVRHAEVAFVNQLQQTRKRDDAVLFHLGL